MASDCAQPRVARQVRSADNRSAHARNEGGVGPVGQPARGGAGGGTGGGAGGGWRATHYCMPRSCCMTMAGAAMSIEECGGMPLGGSEFCIMPPCEPMW